MIPKYGFDMTMLLSEVVGGCFELSAKRGYNSKVMAEQVMTTDYGRRVMTAVCLKEYSSPTFMLDGYEKYAKLKKGKPVYPLDAMWYAGFLYKYWVITRDMTPKEIYAVAPLERIVKAFPRLHTQGWEFAIEEFTEGLNLTCEVYVPKIGDYGENMVIDRYVE